MNNEEMNLTPENEGVEENKVEDTKESAKEGSEKKKLPANVIAVIISGFVFLIVAIVMLFVLFPANDGGNQGGGNENGGNAGDNTDTKVTYSVTVVDQDGNPVKDAVVYFYPEGGVAFFYKTNSNGVTDGYRTDKKVTASILAVPNGYEYDNISQKQSFDKDGKLTVTITKIETVGVNYLIRVVDQYGNAVVGAKVQMCESANEGICLSPILTDENGEAIYVKEEKEFKAAIFELPDGYKKVNDDYVNFENGVAKIVVNKIAE